MSIKHVTVTIICDNCMGRIRHGQGTSVAEVVDQAKHSGWVFTTSDTVATCPDCARIIADTRRWETRDA
jgi:uncharacterized protein with PIN domain